jgi:UDP-GlcNAc:undecaprenyl-phosphate GlcNAc-1-phosphate transferase
MELQILLLCYLACASAVVSSALVYLSMPLARRWGVLDHPVGGRVHPRSTPLMGGVAMFLSLALIVTLHALGFLYREALFPAWFVAGLPDPDLDSWFRLAALLLAALVIVLTGLYDDCVGASVGFRLTMQTICAGLLVVLGVRPTLAHIHPALVAIVTTVWIVGITNAFNLLDGLDGLAGGVAAVATFIFLLFMLMTGQMVVALLLAVMLGVETGFLLYNWHPARTFMGSAGSLLLGFLLASVPLVSDFMQRGNQSLAPLALPVLVLSVPLYDTISVMVLRLWNRRTPFRPDRNHLAHRLMRLHLSVRQTVGCICLLGLSTGLMSLLLIDADPLRTALILLSVGTMFAVFVLLERVHVLQLDATRIDNLVGCLRLTGGHGETRYSGPVWMLRPDRIELLLSDVDEAEMGSRFRCASPLDLTLTGRDGGTDLTIPCRGESFVFDGGGLCRAVLALPPGDGENRSALREWISRSYYPGRGE